MKIYFFQHMLTEYNLPLYKKLGKDKSFNISFYFDSATEVMLNDLGGFIGKSFAIRWKSLGRQMELYLSHQFLWRVIRDRPSIVLTEDGSNILNNLALVFLRPIINYKLVIWGLGDIPGRKQSFFKRVAFPFIKFVWRKCDAIVAYSSYGKSIYASSKGVSAGKIYVAQNAVDLGNVEERVLRFKESSPLRSILCNRKVIVYCGRLVPTKRPRDLIQAFAVVSAQMKEALSLVIMGSGVLEQELKQMCEKLNLTNCFFVGHRTLEEASEVFAFSDVCVVPGEGGLVLNHALRHGVPVIVSSGDGTELDLINDKQNGRFFHQGDIADLADKIFEVVSSRSYQLQAQKSKLNVPTLDDMEKTFIRTFLSLESSKFPKNHG